MPAVEATAVLPIAAERAFELAHELGELRAAWDRDVVASRLIRGAEDQGEGVSRFERTRLGRRLILRTTMWHPPLASSCTMTKGPAWLREYGESVRVEPLGEERCRLTWKIAAKLAAPVLPGAAGALSEPLLRAGLERRVAALAEAAELLAEEPGGAGDS